MSKQTDLINIPDAITVSGSNVGIGTTSPAQKLHIEDTSASVRQKFVTSTSNQVSIDFGDTDSGSVGRIQYDHHTDALSFNTNSTERIRILSSGGITFNGDTAAANALSDYEEGTWVPTLGGNAVYDIQTGHYVKVGGLVYASFAIRPTSLGTGSNNRVSGLPFSTADSVGLTIQYYDGAATNHYSISGGVTSNYLNMYLKTSSINSAYNSTNFFQNNARIYASIIYRTTA